MYAITLRPQWAYAVARLGKDVENRTWPLPEYAYQWALIDVQPLAPPVPCRGAQGLWTVPEHVERLVLRCQR
jgi:hypothetical protein